VVVTPGVGSGDDGWHTTERILEAFADPVPGLETAPISGIAASIGVALATTHRIPDAIARADAAMYAAKQAGGNRALLDGHPIPPPEPTRTAVDRGAR
jgi:GGDEF domain-containing protein